MINFTSIALLLLFAMAIPAQGQSILSEYAQNTNFPIQERLSSEKILKFSNSKRVFILSFEEEGFLPGDYVTLIYNEQHVARAVAVKSKDDKMGIKIIKIYSLPLWGQLREGMEVKILRGDDSYFIAKREEETQQKDEDPAGDEIAKIVSEDDLFNKETFLEEDLADDANRTGRIKTDNIVSIRLGSIGITDLEGNPSTTVHFNYSWAHQLIANFWGEFNYGHSNISGFPDENLGTGLQTFTLRIKYTISAPFYSFVKPYVGYKISAAKAPEADPSKDTKTPEQQQELLEGIEYSGPIVGITVLKRLVPGWFAQFDLGTDIISVGMALEF